MTDELRGRLEWKEKGRHTLVLTAMENMQHACELGTERPVQEGRGCSG